ncbi:MAG: phosphoribosyl 1,2-cyclic phosphodiesterase [Alteromonadaceae bacterium]|jgi:phosphoribosyl 1,2-cyclic phosphodiesterase
MKITLRGVRGSIPVPGPDTVTYGGNTTCHEVRPTSGELIIIDGGTGIRQLGNELLAHLPVKVNIFITHTHWDHIQGLPFFLPLFIPGNTIDIYGSFDPVYMKDLRSILSQQMEYCYFPVRECELAATINYHHLKGGETVQIGSAKITSIVTNHPVLNFGYKVEDSGKVFFFTGDYEPPVNIYDPEDEEYEGYQELINEQQGFLVDFIKGADVMIADSQYTMQEYPAKKGWGHGTFESNVELARVAKIKQMHFTHHDPTRTDAQLEAIYADILAQDDLPETEFLLAKEGTVIDL